MDRATAIDSLVMQNIFDYQDIGQPEMEFYIKDMVEHDSDPYDIDRYAHLNTLFNYDIGHEAAGKMDEWIWEHDADTAEMTYREKAFLKAGSDELGLNLDFSKFRITDFDFYRFEF